MKKFFVIFALLAPLFLKSQTTTENYVKTTSYLVETVDGNVIDDQKLETITYYDGLNRPKQGISLRAGGNRQDLITPIVYDQFGRKVKNHLPLAVTNNGSHYYTGNIESQLKTFYRNKFPADFNALNQSWDNPYAEILFDDIPINRVKESAFPGYDWRLGNGGAHTKKYEYKTNGQNEVKKYVVTYGHDNTPSLSIDGYYSQNTLFKSIQKDENWISGLLNTSETFKDKNGKTLLTNSYILENGQIKKLSTYFVYDDFGRLLIKIPPKADENIVEAVEYEDFSLTLNNTHFFKPINPSYGNAVFNLQPFYNGGNLAYYDFDFTLSFQTDPQGAFLKIGDLYTFPSNGNIIPDQHLLNIYRPNSGNTIWYEITVKNGKLNNELVVLNGNNNDPQAEFPIYYLNEGAQFVFDISYTTNLEMVENYCFQYNYDHYNRLVEQKTPGRGWEYMVYDKLDRPVLSQDANLKNQGKWLFTKYDVFGRVVYTGIFYSSSSRVALQSTLESQSTIFENRVTSPITINGTSLYYSNQAFPNSSIDLLTVNYYDTYVDHTGLSLPATTFGVNRTLHTQGLPTVSKVRVIGANDWDRFFDKWITTLSTYDDKGRVIYIDSKNDYLTSRDITRLKLNYAGNIEETHVSHLKTGKPTINIRDYFHYDHIGRLKSHKQKIDDEPVQLINENFYDELGQLHRKDVGGETVLDGYTDIVNMDVTFDGTISHSSNDWNWPSRLKTKGAIVEDGGISFKLVGINNHVRVGLLKPQKSNSTNDYLDYGFYLEYISLTNTYRVNIINNGSLQSTSYTYSPGNTFKVERIGNQVKYYRNGSLISTVTYVGNEESLSGKVAFSGPGGSIENVFLYGPNINKKLQNILYKYNVRGWLTDINNVDINGVERNPGLFNFRINYNRQIQGSAGNAGLAVPLFNGNISQTTWRTLNEDTEKRTYGYKYDGLNRLNAAYSRKGNDLNIEDFHSLTNVSYDLNGNIILLSRDGFIEGVNFPLPWDDLYYTYEGNQLVSVTDFSNNEAGFSGKPDSGIPIRTAEYTYDVNGNLTGDTGKNILNISYNHLDLPEMVTIMDENNTQWQILYVYDALGAKLSKRVVMDDGYTMYLGIVTQYDGNFIYEQQHSGPNTLQFFSHPEGYVAPITDSGDSVKGFDSGSGTITYSSYSYVFQYKDHLGNVRLSYSDLDLNGSIDPSTEIIEENHYYPFGLRHKGYNTAVTGAGNAIAQQYKFGGKQLQEELGLQWYDFGSRNYDATIGRWFNTDPQNQFVSPYLAFGNNPVRYIDPDGEWAILIAAAVGGVVNVVANWNNIKDFGDGLSYFGIGAGAGVASLYGGPLAGAAVLGLGNSMYTQYSQNRQIDWLEVGSSTILSVGTAGIGSRLSPVISPYTSKLFGSSTSLLSVYANNALATVSTGLVLETAAGMSQGQSFAEASQASINNIPQTIAISLIGTTGNKLQQKRYENKQQKLKNAEAVYDEAAKLNANIDAQSRTANARSLGEAGERAVGITDSKTRISINGRMRIPDAMDRTTLTEVKNVKSLSFTRQLRDFHQFSQQTSREFILYTRPNTSLSGPLYRAINQGTITHRYIPFE